MDEVITVSVQGPRLIAQGLCALLNTFPDIQASEEILGVVPKDGICVQSKAAVLLLVMPTVREESVRESAMRIDITQSARLLTPARYSLSHTALVMPGSEAESDLLAACASGLGIFLSANDEARTLRTGIIAADKGESYCSPELTPKLVKALQTRTKAIQSKTTASQHVRLSKREKEVAKLAGEGLSNLEISERIGVGMCTVKAHLSEVYRKLGIKRRSQIHNHSFNP